MPGGRGGLGGYDPFAERKLQIREEQERRLKEQGDASIGVRKQQVENTSKANETRASAVANTQKRFDETQKRIADMDAQELRTELDQGVKAILAIEGKAHEMSGSKFVEGVDEDLQPWKRFERGEKFGEYADTDFSAVDPATGKPGVRKHGSYGAKVDRLIMLARRLKSMKERGIDIGEIAPDTNELLGRLARERGFE
jgi:TolA-binding protein